MASKEEQGSSTNQDASNQNQEISITTGDGFKRPHLKMLNLMKPSLSLTSLPPQSPKDSVDETNRERPYNSLKKKRDIGQKEKELWRRSWESQNSVSTTTSHTGTSTGKNDFWAAYNFIMDNSIIDSCREASGEAKFLNDSKGELKAFKTLNNSNFPFNPSQGSQGSQESDPRRLRRWLREMKNRVSKLPSLKEAIKLNANELKKFSVESSELYREINSNGRFVAACIRSLEKENATKADDIQPKSIDCSEHDSLDTTTSNESKRSENILKALERRYHLLYLHAFEIQCMFEGLLDKRNFFKATEQFQQIETSDEEPIAKIPKFGEEASFSSHKNNEKAVKQLNINECDGDADSECSEEMLALKSTDCVDSIIVPLKKSVSETKTPSPNKENFKSPSGTVIKRSKDISKFNRSNRKSKNCAIFYYKHIDTDNDQINDDKGTEATVSTDDPSEEEEEEEVWEYANARDDEILNSSTTENDHITELLKQNVSDSVSRTSVENNDSNTTTNSTMQQQNLNNASNTTQLITKETLRELVLEAESLVRQKITDQTSKTDYFFNEILLPKNYRRKQQQQKKIMEKNNKDTAKISRVHEWLKKNQNSNEVSSNSQVLAVQVATDCEASGECTSDSEHSDSSEEITDSIATCLLQGIDPMQTSTEGLENTTPVHKVTMRVKSESSSNRRNSDRPWSVSCLSQLTRNSRQSLSDAKVVETTSALASFSISESALNKLQKYKTTSESDSKNYNKNASSTVNSVGSKNSLKKRRIKLRKKSLSSNKKSESGSDIQDLVSKNLLKTMTNSDSFNTTLMEDLSTAISMMTIIKSNKNVNDRDGNHQYSLPKAQKPESDDEQIIKAPDFKIGSLTNVYGNPHSLNLGSLAALANYNNENTREVNETGTENLSSFSEHNSMWDNYMEKYNSEPYSEDRDVDGARKLLEFGDDYRNFIDSQSDCCSSLSAANQLDSLSPPRNRKNISAQNVSLSSSNENSMKVLRQRRIQELPEMERRRLSNGEDRKTNALLEKLRQKASEYDHNVSSKRRSLHLNQKQISSSDEEDDGTNDVMKILNDSKTNFEQTETLRMANPQLLRPEDYDEITKTCLNNIERLNALQHINEDSKLISLDLIASWNNLLNWSENAAAARRLQADIVIQKQLLDSIDVDKDWILNSEEAIREKIHELNNAHEELYRYRSNMLKLNASIHSWISRQELNKNRSLNSKSEDVFKNEQTTQSDLSVFADDELHKHLKDEIVSLYHKWDSINGSISSKLESLKNSLVCWKQFENGLEELQENLSKDRGALNGLKGAIEEGSTSPEELVDNVQQVSKLLSEKLENRIQTISTNEDFMLHPEAALKFIANSSSNGSYQSDSGISDGGFSELSERERRLVALKKIAKQLEIALSPSSEVLKTITQRMEAAESELKVLQDTCRELIVRTSTQLLKQQGIDIPSHAQSQINVQIPIITIKNKLKRSLPRRKRKSPSLGRKFANDLKQGQRSNDETSESEIEDGKNVRWRFLKRVAKLAIPFQLTIITLFCVACFLEPRCCDTLNNLTMSLTPHLRYVKGPPPT